MVFILLQELHWSELCHERDEGGDSSDAEAVPADGGPRQTPEGGRPTGALLSQRHLH